MCSRLPSSSDDSFFALRLIPVRNRSGVGDFDARAVLVKLTDSFSDVLCGGVDPLEWFMSGVAALLVIFSFRSLAAHFKAIWTGTRVPVTSLPAPPSGPDQQEENEDDLHFTVAADMDSDDDVRVLDDESDDEGLLAT